MSVVLTDDIRAQAARYLNVIRDKRSSRLSISNDDRARAMGMFINAKGEVCFAKRGIDQKSGAVRTSWPVNGMR